MPTYSIDVEIPDGYEVIKCEEKFGKYKQVMAPDGIGAMHHEFDLMLGPDFKSRSKKWVESQGLCKGDVLMVTRGWEMGEEGVPVSSWGVKVGETFEFERVLSTGLLCVYCRGGGGAARQLPYFAVDLYSRRDLIGRVFKSNDGNEQVLVTHVESGHVVFGSRRYAIPLFLKAFTEVQK